MKLIDFRSDTITLPTEAMRMAMYQASVGDDVYKEDESINALEAHAAALMKKEAALFMPSGTMGNLTSVLAHTQDARGCQVLLDERSHIFTSEAGGLCAYGSVFPKTIDFKDGIFTAEQFEKAIVLDQNVHHVQSKLICMENSHNFAGGTVTPLQNMKEIHELAKEKGLRVHTDGARVFNAATYLNCPVWEIAQHTDSMMFCLSKGLAAPVGSMIVGSKDFIQKAAAIRKSLGGGMRQAGFLAAAGMVALNQMSQRLDEDHENARLLGEQLNLLDGFWVDLTMLHTNIVMVHLTGKDMTSLNIVTQLQSQGILTSDIDNKTVRFVTHYHLSKNDIEETLRRIKSYLPI